MFVDREHETLPDDGKDSTKEEPGLIPASRTHNTSVGNAEDDQHHDVRQQMDTG